jgi:hypothetical protein
MEFHFPFFALRKTADSPFEDNRTVDGTEDGKPFRVGRKLPLAMGRGLTADNYYYYESQISVLVTGVDEWLWSSYCCADTYFGTEPGKHTYLEGKEPSEPATGGSKPLMYPMWNPREFFLCVLSRRVMQAVGES